MKSYRHYVKRVLARLTMGTLVTIAVPLFVLLLVLRVYGLPEVAKDYLLNEIQRRHILPFPVAVDSLQLDPTGAILANRVTVFRDTARQSIMLQVDRVRVSVAWLSWWRGRGFIDSASIANAEVDYPIGPTETADLHEVNADVAFDGKDIKIENADARFLVFALSVHGTIHNDGFPVARTTSTSTLTPAQQMAAREDNWRTIVKAVDDIGTEQPIGVQFEFETSTHDLGGGKANFALDGRHLTWRNAPVDEFSINGTFNDGMAELGIEPLAIWPGHDDAVGVVSFNVPGWPAREVGTWLSEHHGVGVRSGRFCAHPLLERLGPPDRGAIRASLGLGSSGADVDALLGALAELMRARAASAV